MASPIEDVMRGDETDRLPLPTSIPEFHSSQPFDPSDIRLGQIMFATSSQDSLDVFAPRCAAGEQVLGVCFVDGRFDGGAVAIGYDPLARVTGFERIQL